MSIKKAANFASKMYKENQHTLYKCCRIAADYYDVSATDVQKELSSRGGKKNIGKTSINKGKKLKIYRILGKLEFGYDYSENVWDVEVDEIVKAYTKDDAYKKATKNILKNYPKGTFIYNIDKNDFDEIVKEVMV